MQVRLADFEVPGCLEPAHGFGGLGRHVVGEEDRAVGRHEAGGVEEVLDRQALSGRRVLGALGPREEDAVGSRQSKAR